MPKRDRKKKRHKRRHTLWKQARRKRRRARRGLEDTDLMLLHLLQQLQGHTLYPRPPVDPYARGGNVPPMQSSHRVAFDQYRQAAARPQVVVGPPGEAPPHW